MEIRTNAENRKELVKAIADHFGERSEYLGPPSFAYRIGNIMVDREATVIFEDESMEDEVRRVLFQNDVMEEAETGTEQADTLQTEIKIPIGEMKPQGIINLINMLHSKQYLINRAVGRECFNISDSLTDALAEQSFDDTTAAANFIDEQNGCKGITFADGNIHFTGFPQSEDTMEYCRLAAAMVKRASEQKRVNPKQTIEENEKYYMRAWLVSIGFGGGEGKEVRDFFLKNLKGHTAFRTHEDAERWKENRRMERGSTVCSE